MVNVITEINITRHDKNVNFDRRCSPPIVNFAKGIFKKFEEVHKAAYNLFNFEGVTKLLECGEYLTKFYYFATHRRSTMICPRH